MSTPHTPSPFSPSPDSSAQSANALTPHVSTSVRYTKQHAPPSFPFPHPKDGSPSAVSTSFTDCSSDASYLGHPSRNNSHRSARITIAHPYARLYAKKDASKRRKIWNHVLEKQLFTPQELSTMGAPHRRTIYLASLEAHIDKLHNQLLGIGLYPIPFERLEPYRGLNSKTAKSMVAGMQHDATHTKLKLLELERSINNLRRVLDTQTATSIPFEADARRHSVE